MHITNPTLSMTASHEQAKAYLFTHHIPQIFESLLSSLMMERPADPVSFIEDKIQQIREIGATGVNWETFVFNLHPYRDALRRSLVHDGSSFDKEDDEKKSDSENGSTYQPDVFELTETESIPDEQ